MPQHKSPDAHSSQLNKAALIVGAGDDTGAAIAEAFAAEGYTACIVRRERHADKLELLAASIRAKGHKAIAYPGRCPRPNKPSSRWLNQLNAM